MRKYKTLVAAALTMVVIAVYGLAFSNGATYTASSPATVSADPAGAYTAADRAEAAGVSAAAQSETAAQPCDAASDYARLFDDTVTHHLTVYISQSEWDGVSQDMLDYRDTDALMRTGSYRHADLVYEDDYGTIRIDNVGFRTRGNTTRILPEDEAGFHRAHFALKFDETFGLENGTAEYAALHNRSFCGLDKLDLKWNLWTDLSHIRELYCYELLAEAGVITSRVSLTTLDICIEGRLIHYGVYLMVEPVDKQFLTRRFGRQANDGNLYKCGWENLPATLADSYEENEIGVKDWESGYRPTYDLQTNEAYATTWDIEVFIDNINNLDDEAFVRYIDRSFEVDMFLRLMAVNMLVGTPDDYRGMGNNYYLYFNNAGKTVMIPFDYDASLGGGWDGNPVTTYEAIATEDIYTAINLDAAYLGRSVSHPLADRILAISEYRQRYENYLEYFIDSGLFSYESFLNKFEALSALYAEYACSDTEDCGEVMTLTTEEWYFETKIGSVFAQLPQR